MTPQELQSLRNLGNECEAAADEIVRLRAERDALQARVDALMQEYCPDEMTREQRATWAAHQQPVAPAVQSAIDAALREGK